MLHLTEDQIDDHLIGDLAAEAQSHLDTCDHCQTLIAEASAPLHSFRATSLAWSERRSATLPTPVIGPVWGKRLAWGTAMTATLVLAFTIPSLHHPVRGIAPAELASAATGATGTLEGAEQINNDNRLLQDIDTSLAGGSETPAALGLATETSPDTTKTRGTI